MTQTEIDRLYDQFAELVDEAAADQREKVLARLAIALAERLDDYGEALEAIKTVRSTI